MLEPNFEKANGLGISFFLAFHGIVVQLKSRVEEYFIDTKSAENRRKKQYPSFVISCQISV